MIMLNLLLTIQQVVQQALDKSAIQQYALMLTLIQTKKQEYLEQFLIPNHMYLALTEQSTKLLHIEIKQQLDNFMQK